MRSLHADDHLHLGWDAALPAAVTIAPGDEVELELQDAFGGQLPRAASPADVATLDLTAANPLTGPVDIEGARAGDVLAIEVLEVTVGPVGWTAVIEGFGLLAEDFPDPHVVVSEIGKDTIAFGDVAVLPARPFLGVVGLAPAAPGPHSVIPPRAVGGNLDCRDVRPGAVLRLPVQVDGGRLSLGDPHGTQGDGEVCGTAVETSAHARVRVHLERDRQLDAPELALAPGPTGDADATQRRLTMGVGADLMRGARDATRRMIEVLTARGLAPADAYALCSVAGHLRIIEVVDAPNWVVGLELDLGVLR